MCGFPHSTHLLWPLINHCRMSTAFGRSQKVRKKQRGKQTSRWDWIRHVALFMQQKPHRSDTAQTSKFMMTIPFAVPKIQQRPVQHKLMMLMQHCWVGQLWNVSKQCHAPPKGIWLGLRANCETKRRKRKLMGGGVCGLSHRPIQKQWDWHLQILLQLFGDPQQKKVWGGVM